MIIKEAVGLGSTVEAAREDAIAKLNADLDDDLAAMMRRFVRLSMILMCSQRKKNRLSLKISRRKP